jgi:hypothetical protein
MNKKQQNEGNKECNTEDPRENLEHSGVAAR